jgi:hypothetical protein
MAGGTGTAATRRELYGERFQLLFLDDGSDSAILFATEYTCYDRASIGRFAQIKVRFSRSAMW